RTPPRAPAARGVDLRQRRLTTPERPGPMVGLVRLQDGVRPPSLPLVRFLARVPARFVAARLARLTPGLPLAAIVVALLILTRDVSAPGLGLVDGGAMALLVLAGAWQTLLVY